MFFVCADHPLRMQVTEEGHLSLWRRTLATTYALALLPLATAMPQAPCGSLRSLSLVGAPLIFPLPRGRDPEPTCASAHVCRRCSRRHPRMLPPRAVAQVVPLRTNRVQACVRPRTVVEVHAVSSRPHALLAAAQAELLCLTKTPGPRLLSRCCPAITVSCMHAQPRPCLCVSHILRNLVPTHQCNCYQATVKAEPAFSALLPHGTLSVGLHGKLALPGRQGPPHQTSLTSA